MANLTPSANRAELTRRAGLILALWLGFWLLIVALVAGLVWIPFAQIHYKSSLDLSGVIAGCAAFTLALALWPRTWFKRSHSEPPKQLDRTNAKALYELVEKIGVEAGIRAPVHIHLMGAASASISAERNWFGKLTALRVGLGLPLFSHLSEAELSSVIAHEFGHFVGGDLALGPWVYRTRTSIGTTIAELDESMFFLDVLFRAYGHWFLKLSSAVSRAQEFSADAHAAKRFGPAAIYSALEKIHLIDPMWSAYLNLEVARAMGRGARLPIFEGFQLFCAPGDRRPDIQIAIQRAENQAPAIYDTHPTLNERLAALPSFDEPNLPTSTDCLGILGGANAVETAWHQQFSVEQLTTASWNDYGNNFIKPALEKRFSNSWWILKACRLRDCQSSLATYPNFGTNFVQRG